MQEVKSYPTEARRRQKARAKAGHIPKKKPQVAEQTFDDCGEDFSPLLMTVADEDYEKELN